MELGDRGANLSSQVYSTETFSTILNLFTAKEHIEMYRAAKVHGECTQDRMEDILERLETMREEANVLDRDRIQKERDKGSPPGGGNGAKGHATHQGVKFFKRSECRICLVLKKGPSPDSDLFLNHRGSNPWDCPKFVGMDALGRRNILLKANICLICTDPKAQWSHLHYEDCKKKSAIQSGLKGPHTCKVDRCHRSIWVCVKHKDEPVNTPVFQKNKDLMAGKGWIMGMVSRPSASNSPSKSPKISKPGRIVKAKSASGAAIDSEVTAMEAGVDNQGDLGSEEARVEEFLDSARAKGQTVIEEPPGRPIFQYFFTKGKSAPVLTFMDSGCSDAVVREGVPGVQWDGVVTKKGPFDMGGVGGLAAQTRDEWMVLVPLADGSKQAS